MNEVLKPSIESRKSALFSSYDIKDPGNLKAIEDYFKKVEEFAKDYNDVMEFETAFASSPLQQEYSDLFVQIMNTENQVKIIDLKREMKKIFLKNFLVYTIKEYYLLYPKTFLISLLLI